jgi:hypothetical protein
MFPEICACGEFNNHGPLNERIKSILISFIRLYGIFVVSQLNEFFCLVPKAWMTLSTSFTLIIIITMQAKFITLPHNQFQYFSPMCICRQMDELILPNIIITKYDVGCINYKVREGKGRGGFIWPFEQYHHFGSRTADRFFHSSVTNCSTVWSFLQDQVHHRWWMLSSCTSSYPSPFIYS